MQERVYPLPAYAAVYLFLISREGTIWLACYYELVFLAETFECVDKYVKTLVFSYQAEKKNVLQPVLQSESLFRFQPVRPCSEMGIEGMRDHCISRIRGYL